MTWPGVQEMTDEMVDVNAPMYSSTQARTARGPRVYIPREGTLED